MNLGASTSVNVHDDHHLVYIKSENDKKYVNVYNFIQPYVEFSFSSICVELNVITSCEGLKIKDCPTMISAINWLPIILDKYLKKFSYAKCVQFKIDESITELNDQQFMKFAENFKNFQWTYLIMFESTQDGSFCIYWHLERTIHIFSLSVGDNTQGLNDFIRRCLFESLKNGQSGEKNSNYTLKKLCKLSIRHIITRSTK